MSKLALGPMVLFLAGCPDGPKYQIVFDELEAALLSVWGTSADDVWAVGADAGTGPLVLHYDGTEWESLDTGATGDLWWVSGLGDDVWMSGEGGLVLRYRRSTRSFQTSMTPEAATLYGIFPIAANDVWCVGGDIDISTGVVFRWDGAIWSEATDIPAEALEDPLFKVWGRSSEDLWIVGLAGSAFHRGAGGFETVAVPTGRRLSTVHGNATLVVGVGGFASGLIVEGTGTTLTDVTPTGALQVNGVWVSDSGVATAVGNEGTLYERSEEGTWEEDTGAPYTRLDYHAVYVDPEDGVWAVGGQIATEPLVLGRLLHRGRDVSDVIVNP